MRGIAFRFTLKRVRNSLSTKQAFCLRNEQGVALGMVLILSAIILAIIAGLIYMITSTTQISGMQKRYKTALDAGIGVADVTYQVIALKENPSERDALWSALSYWHPEVKTPELCSGVNIEGKSFTGLDAKLNTPTTSWSSGCDSGLTINPNVDTSYDLLLETPTILDPDPKYRLYVKIVDTVEGNTGGETGLLKSGVVNANSGEVSVTSIPWLYSIEIDSQRTENPSERAKLSILYQN